MRLELDSRYFNRQIADNLFFKLITPFAAHLLLAVDLLVIPQQKLVYFQALFCANKKPVALSEYHGLFACQARLLNWSGQHLRGPQLRFAH